MTFRRKNKRKLSQDPNNLFTEKKPYLKITVLKEGQYLLIFYCKKKSSNEFYVFTTESSFGNISESSEIRSESSLLISVKVTDFFESYFCFLHCNHN